MALDCLASALSGACLLLCVVAAVYRRDRDSLARALAVAEESRREAFEAWRQGNPDRTLMMDLRVIREEFADTDTDTGTSEADE